jgi:hypothetical protein
VFSKGHFWALAGFILGTKPGLVREKVAFTFKALGDRPVARSCYIADIPDRILGEHACPR